MSGQMRRIEAFPPFRGAASASGFVNVGGNPKVFSHFFFGT